MTEKILGENIRSRMDVRFIQSKILFRDWYTFIYPLFFLVSDSFKEAYKNQENGGSSSEIPRLYILFFVLYLYPSSSVFFVFRNFRAQAGDVVQKTYALYC